MVCRLSLVLCLLAVGLEGLGREPDEGFQPPIPGHDQDAVRPPPPPGEGFAGVPLVQILFHKPDAAKVYWDATKVGSFDSPGLSLPGRQNFSANGLYRLRLTDLSERKGEEFFPTLEIGPFIPRSEKFLAVNAIPVRFTPEDLDHASRGIAVTKVIYLLDEEFTELALEGVNTLVSFRLDPGVDPITEADRRGLILAIVRLRDMKVAVTPADLVAESPKSEPATAAEPANSSAQVLDPPRRGLARPGRVAHGPRRGWLRRR